MKYLRAYCSEEVARGGGERGVWWAGGSSGHRGLCLRRRTLARPRAGGSAARQPGTAVFPFRENPAVKSRLCSAFCWLGVKPKAVGFLSWVAGASEGDGGRGNGGGDAGWVLVMDGPVGWRCPASGDAPGKLQLCCSSSGQDTGSSCSIYLETNLICLIGVDFC